MLKTPLYDLHVQLGAKMVPFGGWTMPVQYSGVIDEHKTVRQAVGLFDVSHMGEVEFVGKSALEAVNYLITNDVTRIVDGQALYTVMCKPDGGIIDDLVVYRINSERILICVNASNIQKDFSWMKENTASRFSEQDCTVSNRSDSYAQIAIQGPKAATLLQRLTKVPLHDLKSYRFAEGNIEITEQIVPAIIARTGYTGEDGFEIYIPSEQGSSAFVALLEQGKDLGAKPAGLGARDSLRLEMRFPLYGNDIDETTNPLEAGLQWVVKLDKIDFIGKDALVQIQKEGIKRKLVGFEMSGRGIARQGYPVLKNGVVIGKVTSGTMGPSVEKAIGMAYVAQEHQAVGTSIDIDIRNQPTPAMIVKTPFYKKS